MNNPISIASKQTGRRTQYAGFVVLAITMLGTLNGVADTTTTSSHPPRVDQQRIASVGGALTEIVYALGAEERLIGVDTTSRWPTEASQLPQLGYSRQLSAEGLLSLQPNLILAIEDAGPPDVIKQIRDAGINIHVFPNDYTMEGVVHKVQSIADILQLPAAGEKLAASIRNEFNTATAQHDATKQSPRVLFLLSLGNGSPLASGSGTAADAVIAMAGGQNVFDYPGYKPASIEAIVASAPEVILAVSNNGEDIPARTKQIMSTPGVAQTPAGKNQHIIIADGLRLLGFGPRLGEAVADLARQFHSPAMTTGQHGQ